MKYFEKMLEICLPLLRVPNDYATMNKMDRDEIDRSRDEVGLTIIDCCMVLGTQRCAFSLYRVFSQCCEKFMKMPLQNWVDMEASMYAFVKIQREILHSTNNGVKEPYVDQIMGGSDTSKPFSGVFTASISIHGFLVSKAPTNKIVSPLRNTCLDIMGTFSSWLSVHPELLEHVYINSVKSLGMAETRHFAARVFQDVSHACGAHLARSTKLFQNLLKVHLDAVRAPLPKRELLLITEALASVVKRLSNDSAKEALRQLLAPCTVTLKTPNSIENVILILETMKSVFSSLGRVGRDVDRSMGEMVYRTVENIWADMTRLSNEHCMNGKFSEKLCGMYKYLIRFLGHEYFKNFAQSYCKQMADLFQKSRQSSFLYASGIAVESLSNVTQARGMLSQMLFHFTNTVLALCSNENNVRNNPDIVEDFFDFCGRYVKYCPDLLLGPSNLERCATKIFDFCVFSLNVEHREANRSAIFFLQDVLKLGTKKSSRNHESKHVAIEGMRKLLNAFAPKLVQMMFTVTAGSLSLGRVDDEDASITRLAYVCVCVFEYLSVDNSLTLNFFCVCVARTDSRCANSFQENNFET